jgi:HNH endonuclease
VRRERLRDGQVSPLTILAPTDSQLAYIRSLCDSQGWQFIIAEKGGPCRGCEGTGTGGLPLGRVEFHHLVSRAQGGDDVPPNIIPLCPICHADVTDRRGSRRLHIAASLTDEEYAYVVGKLGPDALWRLFGVRP